MALSNLFGWAQKNGEAAASACGSACGAGDNPKKSPRPAVRPAAPGTNNFPVFPAGFRPGS